MWLQASNFAPTARRAGGTTIARLSLSLVFADCLRSMSSQAPLAGGTTPPASGAVRALKVLTVQRTEIIAIGGREAVRELREYVLLPSCGGESAWGSPAATLTDRTETGLPLTWCGDAAPESDVAAEIVETALQAGKGAKKELRAVQKAGEKPGEFIVEWEEAWETCWLGEVLLTVGMLGVGRAITRLVKVEATPSVGGRGPKESAQGLQTRKVATICKALGEFTVARVGMEGAHCIVLVPATEGNVMSFMYGVAELNRAFEKSKEAYRQANVVALIDNIMHKYPNSRGKIALGLGGEGAEFVKDALTKPGRPVGCFSRDVNALVGVAVTMSRPEGNGTSAAEECITMRKASSFMTSFRVFLGGIEMESFLGSAEACNVIFGGLGGIDGSARIVDDTLECVGQVGGTALQMSLAVPVTVARLFSAGLNAWVGFCASGTRGERSDGIVVPATGPMGLQMRSARGIDKYEFVVATGATGLRKAMGNAGMETRDARVTGEAASEIKKLMQEQAAGHRKELERVAASLAEAVAKAEESVGGRVDDMATELNEVTSNVGVVRGKIDKVGSNVVQHLAAHMQPTYALLRDIAPLVGVQVGPEHEMAALEELPMFSPAGGTIVSPPGKGEQTPARKPPGLAPRELSGAMEVEKEEAAASEAGAASEEGSGSDAVGGAPAKDKKKKK